MGSAEPTAPATRDRYTDTSEAIRVTGIMYRGN